MAIGGYTQLEEEAAGRMRISEPAWEIGLFSCVFAFLISKSRINLSSAFSSSGRPFFSNISLKTKVLKNLKKPPTVFTKNITNESTDVSRKRIRPIKKVIERIIRAPENEKSVDKLSKINF